MKHVNVMDEFDLCWQAMDLWGVDTQKQKAIEELAELIRAIARNDLNNIIEEIVDVEIMLKQIRIIYQIKYETEVAKKIEKLERLRARIHSERSV